MKAYKLVEKREDSVSKIAYRIKEDETKNECYIYLLDRYSKTESEGLYMSSHISETKRGWTIKTGWLTSRPVKIFLPRENFEKVEIEE